MTTEQTPQWTPPKNWRWMPGMLDKHGNRLGAETEAGYYWVAKAAYTGNGGDDGPDFSDPATLGCLLALVREAWGEPTAHAQFYDGTWRIAYWNTDNFFWAYWPEDTYPTEYEALLAALEAAP